MVHGKNYETVSTFVKVMQRKLWPLFSGHGVQLNWHEIQITVIMDKDIGWFMMMKIVDFIDSKQF